MSGVRQDKARQTFGANSSDRHEYFVGSSKFVASRLTVRLRLGGLPRPRVFMVLSALLVTLFVSFLEALRLCLNLSASMPRGAIG